MTTSPIVIMGVQGSGKTTVGSRLAARLDVPFVDGDRLHPAGNVERMAAGLPLDDEHRTPWLRAVGETLAAADGGIVVACSALRRRYRDTLRDHRPDLRFVELFADYDVVARRIAGRRHEFMPPSLLRSQFEQLEPLEPDERGWRVAAEGEPEDTVVAVLAAIGAGR